MQEYKIILGTRENNEDGKNCWLVVTLTLLNSGVLGTLQDMLKRGINQLKRIVITLLAALRHSNGNLSNPLEA